MKMLPKLKEKLKKMSNTTFHLLLALLVTISSVLIAQTTAVFGEGHAGGSGGSSGSSGGVAVTNVDVVWFSKDWEGDCIYYPSSATDISGIVNYIVAQGYASTSINTAAIKESLQQAYNQCVNNYNKQFAATKDKNPCIPRVVAIGFACAKYASNGQKVMMSSSIQTVEKWQTRWHEATDGMTYRTKDAKEDYKNYTPFVNYDSTNLTTLALDGVSTNTVFRIVVIDQSSPNDVYDAYMTLHKSATKADGTQIYDTNVYVEGKSEFALTGAQYGVYKTEADAQNDQNRIETLTIGGSNTAKSKTYKCSDEDSKTFYVKELKAPDNGRYEINTKITKVTLSQKDNNDVNVDEGPTTYPVVIQKRIEGTDTGLAGAKLHLEYQKADGSWIPFNNTWTSDGSNKTFSLFEGTWRIVEDEAPAGYYKSQPVVFTVNQGDTGTKTVTMDDPPIKLKVAKINLKDNTEFVDDAVLQILDNNLKTTGIEWTTKGEEHVVDTSTLRSGSTYYVHEAENPKGYFVIDSDIQFKISEYKPTGTDEEGYVVIDVADPPIDYEVSKVNGIDTKQLVSGAKLAVYKVGAEDAGQELETWITGENGETVHKLNKLNLEVGQSYVVKEIEAPKGYYPTAERKTFRINASASGQTIGISIENYPISYSIAKVDEDGEYVAGAKLRVYTKNADGTEEDVDTWTTTAGTHSLGGKLEEGKTYYVQEVEAPKGYYRSTAIKEFTVKQDSTAAQEKEQTIYFEDTAIEYSLEKTDGKGTFVADAEFTIYDSEGNEVTTITTNDQGPIDIDSSLLTAGATYKIKETKAPNGFYLCTEEKTFTVPATVQEAAEAKKNDANVFKFSYVDKPVKLSLAKVDENGNYVAGATLGIYSDEAGEDRITQIVSEEAPIIITNGLDSRVPLEPGRTYYVRELNAPNGYYLNEGAVAFSIPETDENNGATIKVNFKNIKIQWRISKTDVDGKALTTAKDGTSFILNVYDTNETTDNIDDDELVATLDTSDTEYKSKLYFDMEPYINEGKVKGGHTYRIHEVTAASGYKYAEDVFVKVSLEGKTDDTILRSSMSDESFIVYLKKVDQDGKTLTEYTNQDGGKEGFTIEVYNVTRNKLVYELKTAEDEDYKKNGYIDLSAYLNADDVYVVRETKVPVGYYQAKDVTFSIDTLEYDEKGVAYINMMDPIIKAQFRKEDSKGVVVYSGSDGKAFKFTIIDVETGKQVGSIDTLKDSHTDDGWFDIGKYLEQGKTYRIHEVFAPTGYAVSLEDAYITVPDYYNDKEGNVINVKVTEFN